MSLKYRLIILTVLVFAVTFGAGTLLGVYGARGLAESQLRLRLRRWAAALAASGIPLNDEVLARLAPLLDAGTMVLDASGEIVARSGADWPWDRLRRSFTGTSAAPERLEAGDQRFYCGVADGRLPVTGEPVKVVLLADESAVREPTRTILFGYLIVLSVAAVLLSAGMYLVGLGLVRRIKRLSGTIDATMVEGAPGGKRAGDELDRLSRAFDDLLKRLRHSRERLLAQQRLVTTGKIASSVAHEVRNPLQAMKLTVQMLREKCPEDLRQGFQTILGEIDRLTLLTDELLVLAGRDTRRVEPVDLAHELHQTLRLLQHQLGQREIRTRIELATLPAARMDRSRCRQLLLNLLLNAAEASPRGGTVVITGAAGKDGVVVRIADSGPGFPPPVLDGRAEELFSTKTSGAGLGLSICRRILTEAGGRLDLYNTHAGAVAEATLPIGGAASEASACGQSGLPPDDGRGENRKPGQAGQLC